MPIDFDNFKAFAPFFERDCVTIEWRNTRLETLRGTFSACVLDEALAGDPLAENDVEGVATLTVLLATTGDNAWQDQTPPRVGDIVSPWNRRRFRISSVKITAVDYITLSARAIQ